MEIIIAQEQERIPVTVFEIKGFINMGTISQLEAAVDNAFQAGMRRLLIDLHEVRSLTSAGLRSLIKIHKILSSASESVEADQPPAQELQAGLKSAYLKLCRPQPDIRQVLNIAGFVDWIDVYDDRQAALESF